MNINLLKITFLENNEEKFLEGIVVAQDDICIRMLTLKHETYYIPKSIILGKEIVRALRVSEEKMVYELVNLEHIIHEKNMEMEALKKELQVLEFSVTRSLSLSTIQGSGKFYEI